MFEKPGRPREDRLKRRIEIWAAVDLLQLATLHALERGQFGRPLADNQGIQWTLAETAAELRAARLAWL